MLKLVADTRISSKLFILLQMHVLYKLYNHTSHEPRGCNETLPIMHQAILLRSKAQDLQRC